MDELLLSVRRSSELLEQTLFQQNSWQIQPMISPRIKCFVRTLSNIDPTLNPQPPALFFQAQPRHSPVKHSRESYNRLIYNCASKFIINSMWDWFLMMRRTSIQPDEETFSHLMHCYARTGTLTFYSGNIVAVERIFFYAINPEEQLSIPGFSKTPLKPNIKPKPIPLKIKMSFPHDNIRDDKIPLDTLYLSITKVRRDEEIVSFNSYPQTGVSSLVFNADLPPIKIKPHTPVTPGPLMYKQYLSCILQDKSVHAMKIYNMLTTKSDCAKDVLATMIVGLCNHGQIDQAEALLVDGLKSGTVDIQAFENLIIAKTNVQGIEAGLELIDLMARNSLSPGPAVFHALIDRYTRQGNSKQAHTLYLSMIETGMKPLPDTFKVMLTYLSDMYSTLMKHETPKRRIWTTVQEAQLMNREHVFEKAIDRIVHNTNPGANRKLSSFIYCAESGSVINRTPNSDGKVMQLRTSKFNFTQNIKKSRISFIDSHALFRSFKMHHFVTRLYKLPSLSIIYKKIPSTLKRPLLKSPYIYPFIVADIYSQFRACARESPKANNAVYCSVVLFFLDVDIYVSLKALKDCIIDGYEPSFRMCSALATALKLHGKFSADCLPWGQNLRALIPKPKYEHYDQSALTKLPSYPNIEPYDIFDHTETNIVAALLCVALGTDNTTQLKLKDFIDNNPPDDVYLPLLIRHCQIHNYWWILKSITDPVVDYDDEACHSTKLLM